MSGFKPSAECAVKMSSNVKMSVFFNRLGEQASCPTNGETSDLVQCLRDLSVQDLITAQASTATGFYPTVDGVFLPEHPRVLSLDPDRIERWSHLMGEIVAGTI